MRTRHAHLSTHSTHAQGVFLFNRMALKDSALKFVIFLGSVRDGNMGSRAAKFIVSKLEARGHQTALLDPEVLDLPLLKKPYHFYKDKSQAPKVLQDTNQVIVDADAFILVSAEYNHSMPPALTNLLDHFPIASYKYRPSGIVCYSLGQFGGVRAAMQCRMILGELATPSVGPLFAIPQINKALSETGEPLNDHMNSGADKLIKELEWYSTALKKQRDSVGIPQ